MHPPPATKPGWPWASLSCSLVALATPFHHGALDESALSRLCERQVAGGSAALVTCGSTGEGAALTVEEHRRIVAIAVEAAAGHVPVIAACGAPCTEAAVALAAEAARSGAAGLLCAAPPYMKPTQEGIIAHIRALAHAADRPIMLYDVPSRAGVSITDATVARLFESGLIAAIKDATADLARVPRLQALCGRDLIQLSGDDATAPAYRAMGGHGCVSVTANLVPRLCALQHMAWDRGEQTTFERVRDLLAPLHAALFLESNPIPLKAAMNVMELCSDQVRLPLTRASAATRDQLSAVLAEVGRAEHAWTVKPRLAAIG